MIVIDSSTLILLAKSELLDKFIEEFADCCITEAVMKETTLAKEKFDSVFIRKRIEDGKLKMVKADCKAVKELMLSFGLGVGEAESLSLAISKNCAIAVDDKKAIRVATITGISYLTALTFVVGLKYENKITKEKAVFLIQSLRKHGWYKEEIISNALKEVK